nr:MAG TPA: hypothetical protein [Caudoviricetes sp.]
MMHSLSRARVCEYILYSFLLCMVCVYRVFTLYR